MQGKRKNNNQGKPGRRHPRTGHQASISETDAMPDSSAESGMAFFLWIFPKNTDLFPWIFSGFDELFLWKIYVCYASEVHKNLEHTTFCNIIKSRTIN